MPVSRIYGGSKLICWLWLTLLPGLGFGQDSAPNALDIYQTDAAVSCKFTVIEQDPVWIYAVLEFKQSIEDSLWISYSYLMGDKLLQDSMKVKPRSQRQFFKWAFDRTDPAAVLITIDFNWKGRDWFFQEHFLESTYHGTGRISLWQSSLPMFDSWIKAGDSLLIRSEESDSVYAYYYSHQFDPARPPMAVKPGNGSASLNIDSVFTLKANQHFTPNKQGMYFFQSDSTTTSGVALKVTDRFFPKPQEISDLTEPLIYISTKSEFQTLKQDLSSKQALDKFWLSTVGSPERARSAIKDFYQNVEDANALFTSYKEGWKTDRGMIYTVMGPPLSVNKLGDGENWIYRDAAGDPIMFQFVKVRNIFSNNHYELFRDKGFDRTWFVAIDRWRDGNNP